ncbi:putative porin [Undibacterium sp. GrIS 1.8]|uniref:porin n=1 Tax=unclassified Undibacterium TaxID=2630295 RepID=UPI00339AB320
MKKTTLITLLAALFSGSAYAQSSVTVSGLIDANTGITQYAGQKSTAAMNSGGMSTSYLSFSGTEDLGGGLRAGFDLSAFVRNDTGQSGRFSGIPNVADDTLFSRRAVVTLNGTFGEVRLGRNSTPYFMSMIIFNPMGDSSAFAPIFLHTYTGGQNPLLAPPLNTPDSGASNAVQYSTPDLSGLKGSFQYSFGEVAGNNSKNRISANMNYIKGPLGLSIALEQTKIPLALATEDKQQSLMLGAFYDLGIAKLYAQFAQTKQEFTTANSDRRFNTSQLGAAIPINAEGKLLVSWGHTSITLPATGVSAYSPTPVATLPAGTVTSGVNPTRNTTSIVYDHFISRRTDLYAVFLVDQYTGLENGKTVMLGIRHRF